MLRSLYYNFSIEDLGLNESVVDLSIADDGTIYALTAKALFTSKNPSAQGWTQIDDPDQLIKNANFIEYENDYELTLVTTSDGAILYISSKGIQKIYDGSVPIIGISNLFVLLGNDSVFYLFDRSGKPLELDLGVEAIGFEENNLLAINRGAKWAIQPQKKTTITILENQNISIARL